MTDILDSPARRSRTAEANSRIHRNRHTLLTGKNEREKAHRPSNVVVLNAPQRCLEKLLDGELTATRELDQLAVLLQKNSPAGGVKLPPDQQVSTSSSRSA